jgi:hypothetical protein
MDSVRLREVNSAQAAYTHSGGEGDKSFWRQQVLWKNGASIAY